MKIGLGLSKKKLIQTLIAVDIGTANIKTSLFYIDDGEIIVIGYDRERQKPLAMNKAVIIDTSEVSNSLDKSIGNAISMAEELFPELNFSLPTEMLIGIAGELVSGVPIVVNVERENSNVKITESEIDTILSKVKEYSFESTKDEIAEENGFSASQILEVDTVVNSISVDGVMTRDPVGLSGEEIGYRVFTSFAPRIQVESIQSISNKLKLHLNKIAVEPYCLAVNLDGISNNDAGGIIIDIGAGTTDIAVVKNRELLGIKMFAIGGSNFTKRISIALDTDLDEAEELKLEYSKGRLDEFRKNQIRKAIREDLKSLLLGIEISLDEIDDIEEFPTTFYLCGGGSLLPDIEKGIMEYAWAKRLPFLNHPKVEFLLPSKIIGVTDKTKHAKEIFDSTPLALTRSIFEI